MNPDRRNALTKALPVFDDELFVTGNVRNHVRPEYEFDGERFWIGLEMFPDVGLKHSVSLCCGDNQKLAQSALEPSGFGNVRENHCHREQISVFRLCTRCLAFQPGRMPDYIDSVLTLSSASVSCGMRILPSNPTEIDNNVFEFILISGFWPFCRRGHGHAHLAITSAARCVEGMRMDAGLMSRKP
jgi:hypothetical protein